MQADVVVVGAGSAGCVLAARLSANPDCKVVLIEAGADVAGSFAPAPSVPRHWPALWDTELDWGYVTTRQAALRNRIVACPRGKAIGGSSAINAMIYLRGDGADFDGWRDAGCPGWGASDVLPLFRMSEDFAGGDSAFHGAGGGLRVEPPREVAPASTAFIEAAVACGHPRNADFNAERIAGAGLYSLTQRDGRRCGTAEAFLAPARSRPNLTVLIRTRATSILFEGDRASGVEAIGPAGIERVHAAREVIVCLGAIDSPKLLMLSGIGDERQLRALGLKVRQHLPGVGANLADHPLSALVLLPRTAGWSRADPSGSNLLEAGLFFSRRSPEAGFGADVQFHFTPYAPIYVAARHTPTAMAIALNPCRPRSRGSVRLRSPDPFDTPLIDPAYLSDPDDMRLQIEAVREARRIAATEPLAAMIERELMPGPACTSDADLELFLRSASDCAWHPVGTCRMGVGPDTVVDPELRVRGIRGLRIADASVMPRITSGNTNAPTIMIAEKAALSVM